MSQPRWDYSVIFSAKVFFFHVKASKMEETVKQSNLEESSCCCCESKETAGRPRPKIASPPQANTERRPLLSAQGWSFLQTEISNYYIVLVFLSLTKPRELRHKVSLSLHKWIVWKCTWYYFNDEALLWVSFRVSLDLWLLTVKKQLCIPSVVSVNWMSLGFGVCLYNKKQN